MAQKTEGDESLPAVSPTEQIVVDTAVAAGIAAGTAQVAANEAAEAAADAEEAQEQTEVAWRFTAEMLQALSDRIEALEMERHVSSDTETTEADAGEGETLPEEGETTEVVRPSGDTSETVTIQHRRKFRKV